MTIQRLNRLLKPAFEHRFTILYGEGVDDIYLNSKLMELKFDQAFYEELKYEHFDNVILYSPHRSIYFYDQRSADVSRFANSIDKSIKRKAEMGSGPLPGVRVFTPPGKPNELENKGMGDVHALRAINRVLTEVRNDHTAIVFMQAETSLLFFEDHRSLSALIGDWTNLPPSNSNRVFFVFSTDTYEGLLKIANDLKIPELRTAIQRKSCQGFNLKKVETPQEDEIIRAVSFVQKTKGLEVEELGFERLVQGLVHENRQERVWINRISELQTLNWEEARKAGFFTSSRDLNRSVWVRLDELVGINSVKQKVKELNSWLKVSTARGDFQQSNPNYPNLHMIFQGNPGTGKTTVARLFGEILFELGILKRGHLVEVKASDLIAEFVGGTPSKTNNTVDRALDGVLFIDEAYTLTEEDRGGYGKEAIDTLITRLEDDRHRLVVIAAGYPGRMEKFRNANPGLARRFPQENIIQFEDFSTDELWEIFEQFLKLKSIPAKNDTLEIFRNVILELHKRKDINFGNAGEIRNLIEAIDQRRAFRLGEAKHAPDLNLIIEDLPESYRHLLVKPNKASSLMFFEDLDKLVGIENVKIQLVEFAHKVDFSYQRYIMSGGQTPKPQLQHLLFTGNPGTGKTTVARMVGKFFKDLGLLAKGHVIEVSRADLVAGYIGQTAIKTMEKIISALDGVLFIDEAYSLDRVDGNDFGSEAIDTLVKCMEDYRERLVVIAAGYPQEMKKFLNNNPGLSSRFGNPIIFGDFSVAQLSVIFKQTLQAEGFIFSDEVINSAKAYLELEKRMKGKNFGNARFVRQFVEIVKGKLARRIMKDQKYTNQKDFVRQMNTILSEDIPSHNSNTQELPEEIIPNLNDGFSRGRKYIPRKSNTNKTGYFTSQRQSAQVFREQDTSLPQSIFHQQLSFGSNLNNAESNPDRDDIFQRESENQQPRSLTQIQKVSGQ